MDKRAANQTFDRFYEVMDVCVLTVEKRGNTAVYHEKSEKKGHHNKRKGRNGRGGDCSADRGTACILQTLAV